MGKFLGAAAAFVSVLTGLVILIQFTTGIQTVPNMFRTEAVQPSSRAGAAKEGASACPAPGASPYILPDSDKRLIAAQELVSLPQYRLRLARNEIFARHGYIFDTDMRTYFACQPWYHGTKRDVFGDLSKIERANIALIQSFEKGR